MFYYGQRCSDGIAVGLSTEGKTDWHGNFHNEFAFNPRFDLKDYGHWAIDKDESDFDWGQKAINAGTLQLSLALIADATGNDRHALAIHVPFAKTVIAKLKREQWKVQQRRFQLLIQQFTRDLQQQKQKGKSNGST